YVYGLKGDVKDNIAFIDETTVIYPAGANTILYNLETKAQKFIAIADKCDGITAMAVAPSKRYVAIAERGEKPIAAIYDLHTLRRRKALTPAETESKDFVCMAFSTDGKYILTQSGAPDWTLYYWTWEKTKLMASVKTANIPGERFITSNTQSAPPPSNNSQAGGTTAGKENLLGSVVYQVSFNPNDNSQICVIGNGIFKMFRYAEGSLKPFLFQKFEARNFLCHCWTADERIVIGTDDSRILICEANGELKNEIAFFNDTPPRPCQTLISFNKGFVAGGGGGRLAIYERSDDTHAAGAGGAAKEEGSGLTPAAATAPVNKDSFRRMRDFQLQDETSKIINLTISPSEDSLLCTTDSAQIFSLLLTTADIKGDESKLEVFSQPFHHGQITGMDTCIRKPLIATCSSDKSVRVWNYIDSSSELVKYFAEEAYSVALHPSGLYILVGFSDKLRLMNLLIDDIRPFREFTIRGCRE
ncbi:Cilia- and flagella-associated protein 57, partial [Rhizoclosmatium hyalinum]